MRKNADFDTRVRFAFVQFLFFYQHANKYFFEKAKRTFIQLVVHSLDASKLIVTLHGRRRGEAHRMDKQLIKWVQPLMNIALIFMKSNSVQRISF